MSGQFTFGAAVLCGTLLFAGPMPVLAQGLDIPRAVPPPYPEFTFRRVPAPGPGDAGPRIDIQISPRDRASPVPALPRPVPAPHSATTDWFWSAIPLRLPPDPARFRAAQDLLQNAPEAATLATPRLATLAGIAEAHGRALLGASIETGVSPALALAVIAVESGGRLDAISDADASGLMQLIPATAARFDVHDPFDAGQNIRGGMAYLAWLLGEFGRDPVLALAAYNAGEGAVRAAGGVPDFAETRAYVPKVIAAWMLARSLCLTPPELPTDGCVFRTMAVN